MKTYSIQLRKQVVAACDAREGTREEIAGRFGVSTAWIRRLLQRRRENGSIEPRKRGGCRPAKINGTELEKLKALVDVRPNATLRELRDRSGVSCSLVTLRKALRRLGYHRTKAEGSSPGAIAHLACTGRFLDGRDNISSITGSVGCSWMSEKL